MVTQLQQVYAVFLVHRSSDKLNSDKNRTKNVVAGSLQEKTKYTSSSTAKKISLRYMCDNPNMQLELYLVLVFIVHVSKMQRKKKGNKDIQFLPGNLYMSLYCPSGMA